jgi:uncharacterized protein YciI
MKTFAVSSVFGAFLAIGAIAVAQTTQSTQTIQSTQTSQSGSGRASASASASASAGGSARAGGSQSGFAQGSGGGMAMPTHAIVFEHKDANGRIEQAQTEYYTQLARQSKVMMAGPWREKDGALVILFVKTDQEAERIAQGDPAVKAGASRYVLRRWDVKVVNGIAAPAMQSASVPTQISQPGAGSIPPR